MLNQNILNKAKNIAKSEYIIHKKHSELNYYLFTLTQKQVVELAELFKISVEYVDSLILTTANLRVKG